MAWTVKYLFRQKYTLSFDMIYYQNPEVLVEFSPRTYHRGLYGWSGCTVEETRELFHG